MRPPTVEGRLLTAPWGWAIPRRSRVPLPGGARSEAAPGFRVGGGEVEGDVSKTFIYPSGVGVMDEKKRQSIEESLRKLPVDYREEEGEIVVRVGKGRRLPESQFRATINELKKMGFKFDPDTKTWRKRS